jgi:hypothetical protein
MSVSTRAGLLAGACSLAVLAGCATAKIANTAAQADGKQMTAPPGMARVYLVHGLSVDERTSHKLLVPGGVSPFALITTGAIIAVDHAVTAATRTPDNSKPLKESGEYRIDEHVLGRLGSGDYMAIDLAPGDYKLRYRQGWH